MRTYHELDLDERIEIQRRREAGAAPVIAAAVQQQLAEAGYIARNVDHTNRLDGQMNYIHTKPDITTNRRTRILRLHNSQSVAIKGKIRLFLVLLFGSGVLLAQTTPLPPTDLSVDTSFQTEYTKLVNGGESIGAYDTGLFGDSVNLYTGATEFAATDVALPGNDELAVAFGRQRSIENRVGQGVLALGDWDMDVPYMEVVTVKGYGWIVDTTHPQMRCSSPTNAQIAAPPLIPVGPASVGPREYWQGIHLHVPGQGQQEVLFFDSSVSSLATPTDGRSYRWVTSGMWMFACENTGGGLPGGALGDSYVARSPGGLIYHFERMATDTYSPIAVPKAPPGTFLSVERERVRLYPSRVEDRFGNSVVYNWVAASPNLDEDRSHLELASIISSDNRTLTFQYDTGVVSSVTDNAQPPRTWSYTYDSVKRRLTGVTLPDSSAWSLNFLDIGPGVMAYKTGMSDWDSAVACNWMRPFADVNVPETHQVVITSPSGAKGTFAFQPKRHGRTNVYAECIFPKSGSDGHAYPTAPARFDIWSLVGKTIEGAGLPAPGNAGGYAWTYDYLLPVGSLVIDGFPGGTECGVNGDACKKQITVTAPDHTQTVYTYGIDAAGNSPDAERTDGQLLNVETRASDGSVLRKQTNKYVTDGEVSQYPFPDRIGQTPQTTSDDSYAAERLRPQNERIIVQQGVAFTSKTMGFDAFAYPTVVDNFSNLNNGTNVSPNARTQTTAYTHNRSAWVLGQAHSVTIGSTIASQTDFDPTTALPNTTYSFGKLSDTFAYNFNGTLKQRCDGNSHCTHYQDYFRGIARSITYPTNTQQTAEVNGFGRIVSVTDELQNKTQYDWDSMGRLKKITWPAGDSNNWYPKNVTFTQTSAPEYGLTGPHWKQVATTGTGQTITVYDALWRPLVALAEDAGNTATRRFTMKRYDYQGRETFVSYPANAYSAASLGTTSTFDGLGRLVHVVQDDAAPLGPLETAIDYLSNFSKRTTDPRSFQTVTQYQAFDQPSEDAPVNIVTAVGKPEQTTVAITRDVFGKPMQVQRSGTYAGSPISATRRYVYDAYQLLCKSIEPESLATIQDYDAAGNVAWSMQGFSSTAQTCDGISVPAAQRTQYGYDNLNRLTGISYPTPTPSLSRTYYPDGALHTVGSDDTTWTYSYNKRRLLESEVLAVDARTFSIDWTHDNNGAVSGLIYPDVTTSVDFAPNGLGQPTRAGAFATGVSYFPNGAMARFTYGNGGVHSLTQNTRKLPQRSWDAVGAMPVMDLEYAYDENANVTSITDWAQSHLEDRTLGYDALNRLTTASAPNLWGAAGFSYDPLDNLRSSAVGVRQYSYTINPATNRLDTLSGTGPTIAYGYDARGNVTQRGTQAFVFDRANHLSAATDKESYRYDGLGHRAVVQRTGIGTTYQIYSRAGQLLYGLDMATGATTRYIYLNGSLIARSELTPLGVPDAPQVTAPASNSTGSYTISWTAPTGASDYVAQENRLRADGSATGWRTISQGAATTVALSARGNGAYQYHAKACNAAGCSIWSPIVTTQVSGVTTPATPAGLVADPNPSATGNYELRWPVTPGATQYVLEENANDAGWQIVALYTGTATAFAVSNRSDGSYVYRVSACATGCSVPTLPLTVIVAHAQVPNPPVLSVPAASSSGTYTATWTSIVGAGSYQLQELPDSAWAWTDLATTAGTSVVISGRAPGTWRYQVRACNAAGCGDYSTVATVVVSAAAAPPPPASLSVSPNPSTDGHTTVSWTGVTGADSYTLQWNPGNGWVQRYGGTALSKAESGLANGSYAYQVAACTAGACSTWRGPVTLTVAQPLPPPGPVTGLSIAPNPSTNGTYTLNWTAPVGGTPAETYALEEQINSGAWTTPSPAQVTATQITFSDRGNGDYAYRVRACNHAATPLCNPTNTSPVRMVTVARADGLASPDQIAGPNGCDGPERTYIIGWAPGTPGATYYEVEEGDDRNGSYPLITTSATSIQLTHESISGTTYNYRVRACNAGGCSPWRGTAYACVQPDGPPREPQTAPRTTWLHTDALGSPVAETDANGQVTRRQRYEPYGAPTDGSYIQGPGYTGHVTDAATGLSYMQQRYYDPVAGRFLSVDPVAADGNSGGNFNRYAYVSNNPYRFTDPDGRYKCEGSKGDCAKADQYVSKIKDSKSGTGIKPGEARQIQKVIDYIGKKGGDGPKITPTTLPKNTKASTDQRGNIKIDVNKNSKGADATVHGAMALGHEADHDISAKSNGEAHTREAATVSERSAYGTEAMIGRGLGVNLSPSAIESAIKGSVENAFGPEPEKP